MHISLRSDYALRVLIYLGTHREGLVPTRRISEAYGISRHHLVRVVHTLGEHGYVDVQPGRSGGVRLARDPAAIRLGDVFRDAEPNMRLVECFDQATNTCPLIRACGLKPYLRQALGAFIDSLNRHTLADLMAGDRQASLAAAFVAGPAPPDAGAARRPRRG